jgi:serine/threonine protein kinase
VLRSTSSRRPFPCTTSSAKGVLPLTSEGSLFDAHPTRFGSYRVMDEIGAGRFGRVFRAAGVSDSRVTEAGEGDVAIKVFDQGLSAEQAEMLARALTRLCHQPLDHPSIVAPIGAGLNGATAWLAEPYVNATPLDVVMKHGGRLPLCELLLPITQVAGALDFAAATGVYHVALHPRDILFAGDRVLVTGLGVIQALSEANLDVAMTGATVSPQRAANEPVSHADDIFSLAAITFEAVCGRPIGDRGSVALQMEPVTGVDRGRLAEALRRALADDPAERPRTALELAQALQESVVMADVTVGDTSPDLGADSAMIARPTISIVADDLPLRASAPEPAPEPAHMPDPVHSVVMLNANSTSDVRAESRSVWFPMAAMLAVGLLMGFGAGFVVGQRDFTPAPRTAERAVPRAQREIVQEPVPTPTVGQEFSESAVPGVVEEEEVRPTEPQPRQPAPTQARNEVEEPAPTPTGPASMEVVSRPSGAQVYIDGRIVGRTPLMVSDVNPGDHSVRIALPGHQRWATTVNVAAGSRARVAASLER